MKYAKYKTQTNTYGILFTCALNCDLSSSSNNCASVKLANLTFDLIEMYCCDTSDNCNDATPNARTYNYYASRACSNDSNTFNKISKFLYSLIMIIINIYFSFN